MGFVAQPGAAAEPHRAAACPLQSHPQGCDKLVLSRRHVCRVPTIPLAPSWYDLERPSTDPLASPLPLPAPLHSTTKHIQNFSSPFLLVLNEPYDMPYQTRPKSCLPLPRSCVMHQPLNMQLACNCQSVRRSHWLSITHGQDHSHPSDRACPNEPPGRRSHWNWPHPLPSFQKAQKAPPGFHPLPQRGKDNVCMPGLERVGRTPLVNRQSPRAMGCPAPAILLPQSPAGHGKTGQAATWEAETGFLPSLRG